MTKLTRVIEWDEGADVQFSVPVTQKLDGVSTPVDLTGSTIALEVRDKGASETDSVLHLRVTSDGVDPGITILDPDEGETAAHRMLVKLPDTSGGDWLGKKAIAEIRVLLADAVLPVAVLRFPVTLTPKIVDDV